jgi:hypothetical protein
LAGFVVAWLATLVNFSWLPYAPLWSIILIAVDILVIWALISGRGQAKQADRESGVCDGRRGRARSHP